MNTELHRDNVIQDCEVLWTYSGWSCTALSYSTFLHHFLMILNFFYIRHHYSKSEARFWCKLKHRPAAIFSTLRCWFNDKKWNLEQSIINWSKLSLHRDNVIQDCEVLWTYSGWSCTALSYSTFLHHFLMILNFFYLIFFFF
jgi:hypothetical protein